MDSRWLAEFPGGMMICDLRGVILDMNDRAAANYADEGGRTLIGKNLLDCHPEPARSKFADLLAAPRVNAYTIEKGATHKVIYQAPWFENGEVRGLVELSLVVPAQMPHFVRGLALQ